MTKLNEHNIFKAFIQTGTVFQDRHDSKPNWQHYFEMKINNLQSFLDIIEIVQLKLHYYTSKLKVSSSVVAVLPYLPNSSSRDGVAVPAHKVKTFGIADFKKYKKCEDIYVKQREV